MKRNNKFLKRWYEDLEKYLKAQRVLIIYGPRRVGKTTLLEHFLGKVSCKYRLESGENIQIQELLSSKDFKRLLDYVKGYDILAIDEAQMIPDIGQGLKIIVDHAKDLSVIATGSSSFDLSQHVGEPLTGRKRTLILFPFAHMELREEYTRTELRERLEEYLIYGQYPDVLKAEGTTEKKEVLQELVDSYLLKDILSLDRIKSPHNLLALLKLLAFQVGQLVSIHELATQLGLNVKTVSRYLDLLEKSFVIHRLGGFSRNLRKEITTKSKYYFLDNGVRNGIIRKYSNLASRDDVGALWENFIVTERLKKRTYERFFGNTYFWRTYDGSEIDLIEEEDGNICAYEIKWSPTKKLRISLLWKTNYPDAKVTLITPENYLDFIC